jgi:hypothetical protein
MRYEPRGRSPRADRKSLGTCPTFEDGTCTLGCGLRRTNSRAWSRSANAKTITVTGQLGTNGDRVPTKTTTSSAAVPMLPALERELRAHRSRQASPDLRFVHRDALVFCTTRGRPQSRRNALRAVQHAGDAVGLNGEGRETIGLHDLRHSFVAIALAKRCDVARGGPARPPRQPQGHACDLRRCDGRRPPGGGGQAAHRRVRGVRHGVTSGLLETIAPVV